MSSKHGFSESVVEIRLFLYVCPLLRQFTITIYLNQTEQPLSIKYMYTVQHSVTLNEYIQYLKRTVYTLNISSILLYYL